MALSLTGPILGGVGFVESIVQPDWSRDKKRHGEGGFCCGNGGCHITESFLRQKYYAIIVMSGPVLSCYPIVM